MITNILKTTILSLLMGHAIIFASNIDTTALPSIQLGQQLKLFSNNEESGPKGIEVIGNFGVYFADKKHAKFHDGSDRNVNNVKFVLNNYYWKEDIKEFMRVNYNRDSIVMIETPNNMRYQPSMYVGFGFRYNYSAEWALNVQFNVTKLTAKDMVSVQVFPAFDNDFKSYINFGLVGKESRTKIDIGLVRTFRTSQNIRPMAEFGLNFNNTLVNESYLVVGEQKFSTVDIYAGRSFMPNANIQEYEIRQGGLGYGGYLAGGAKFAFNQFLSLETVAYLYMSHIKLEKHEGFGIHPALIFRIVASPALFMDN